MVLSLLFAFLTTSLAFDLLRIVCLASSGLRSLLSLPRTLSPCAGFGSRIWPWSIGIPLLCPSSRVVLILCMSLLLRNKGVVVALLPVPPAPSTLFRFARNQAHAKPTSPRPWLWRHLWAYSGQELQVLRVVLTQDPKDLLQPGWSQSANPAAM